MKIFKSGFDTETVRQMIELASGTHTKATDITNYCRPGGILYDAQIRRGFFHAGKTRKVVTQVLRRRLAAQLGRKSPRLLDDSHNLTCVTCGGIAVQWDGRWLCENGCGGNCT